MNAKLIIDGKEYPINFQKLVELGIIEESEKIDMFKIGDVFALYNLYSVLIIGCGRRGSEDLYQIAGLDGLELYTDFRAPITKQRMLKFLNDGNYKFVKNINNDVRGLIKV